jgi:hypothetical protein
MWLDLCIDVTIQRGHPLAVQAHVLLEHACDLYLWGLRVG